MKRKDYIKMFLEKDKKKKYKPKKNHPWYQTIKYDCTLDFPEFNKGR